MWRRDLDTVCQPEDTSSKTPLTSSNCPRNLSHYATGVSDPDTNIRCLRGVCGTHYRASPGTQSALVKRFCKASPKEFLDFFPRQESDCQIVNGAHWKGPNTIVQCGQRSQSRLCKFPTKSCILSGRRLVKSSAIPFWQGQPRCLQWKAWKETLCAQVSGSQFS